jgi:5-methylcytosine-specific restriction endonuclease McrA
MTSALGPEFVVQFLRDAFGDLRSTPWLDGLLAIAVVNAAVKAVRGAVHGRHRPDPQRRFSGAQRAEIFTRAGNRCEHHSWLFGRCGARDGLQADHVHPHSRGGATALENGQALCRHHNKQKAARVPWNWQLARLARRREAYFPTHAPRAVVRIRPRVMID